MGNLNLKVESKGKAYLWGPPNIHVEQLPGKWSLWPAGHPAYDVSGVANVPGSSQLLTQQPKEERREISLLNTD